MKFNFTKVNKSGGNENCVIVSKKYKEYTTIKINDIYFDLRHFTGIPDFNICITPFIESLFDLESVKIEFFKKVNTISNFSVSFDSKFPSEIILKQLSKYILCNNKQFNLTFFHENKYAEEIVCITTNGIGYITDSSSELQKSNLKINPDKNAKTASGETHTETLGETLGITLTGVGGMPDQLTELVKEVAMTRNADPDFIKKYNIKHVKGVILYGPPGTGKTLIAKKMGELLNASSVKIISGPEIFDKWVGSSEENIRKLFEVAEKDKNPKSLHIIIFDEIDSIFKERGSMNSNAVYDNVVNQILSKMDGVHPINNILLFGTTNKKELLDPALLRPGRFEVCIEVSAPDVQGRKEIFDIYIEELKNLQGKEKINSFALAQLADNFTGAEIAGVMNKVKRQCFTNQTFRITQQNIIDEIKLKTKTNYEYLPSYDSFLIPGISIYNELYSVSDENYFENACNVAYSISKDLSCKLHKIVCFENILNHNKLFSGIEEILKVLNTSNVPLVILIPDFHILLKQIDKFMIETIINKKYLHKNIFVFGFDIKTDFNTYLK